ncbi:MAG TPA: glycosyltransferase family 4 protein [Spirochaetota bacterium]|nr:glycosyltransferase family 4 protein [Spirochaetota bacterium]
MRVLFLCYRGNPFCGGQGIYLYNLTKELAKQGVEIDVLVGPPYPDPMEEWANVYRIDNLNLWSVRTRKIPYDKLLKLSSPGNFTEYVMTRFHMFPEMESFSFRAFFALKKLLKERSYDLIHDVQCLGWGLLPMKGFGIPIVTTVHHPLTKDREADFMRNHTLWDFMTTLMFYPLTMQRVVINRLDRVITSSVEGVKELQNAFGLKPEKVSVVMNGIDVEGFRNSGGKRVDNELLFVGNTEDHKKGLRYLFEAMTMLPEKITLTIVDEGPPKRLSAFEMIQNYNLEHRVTFTGKVDMGTLVHLYSTKTLLVMSSLHEGFGLPAAEAMACGTPVVTTTAGALKEVVAHGECGLMVPPKDPAALKDAILEVLKDKKKQKDMGKKGRIRAVDLFSWPVAAENTRKVYEDVIATYRSTL